MSIGIHALPESIRKSNILTDHNLQELAGVPELPFSDPAFYDDTVKNIFQYYSINPDEMEQELHRYAKNYWIQENYLKPGRCCWHFVKFVVIIFQQ